MAIPLLWVCSSPFALSANRVSTRGSGGSSHAAGIVEDGAALTAAPMCCVTSARAVEVVLAARTSRPLARSPFPRIVVRSGCRPSHPRLDDLVLRRPRERSNVRGGIAATRRWERPECHRRNPTLSCPEELPPWCSRTAAAQTAVARTGGPGTAASPAAGSSAVAAAKSDSPARVGGRPGVAVGRGLPRIAALGRQERASTAGTFQQADRTVCGRRGCAHDCQQAGLVGRDRGHADRRARA